MKPLRKASLAWLAAVFAPLALADAPIHSINLAPQRDYARVMGEILNCEIRVAVEPGVELETAALPQPGVAVSDFLELRALRWTRQSLAAETIYRISLAYQVFKGVRDAETVTVPALPLRLSHGGQSLEAAAPAWDFTLTPIIPPRTADEAVVLRGDWPPPSDADPAPRRWLWICLAGLAGGGAYAGRRLGLLRRRAPPFRRAARAINQLARRPADAENWRQGLREIHAALNETAGHGVFSGQLDGFLAAKPGYAAARPELEQFFRLSERLFFNCAAEHAGDYPWPQLKTLCRKLAAAEGKAR